MAGSSTELRVAIVVVLYLVVPRLDRPRRNSAVPARIVQVLPHTEVND